MIIIIDDNKDLNDLMSELLGTMGYEVRTALNGEDGIAIAKEKKPAAIICDIGMPGMNGLEVAQYIRRDHELKDVHLIAMSGYSNQADVERSIEAGFEKHLAKPFNLAVIKKALDEAMNVAS